MRKTFEPDGVYAGIPYRVLSNGSIEAMLHGRIVKFKSMDQLLDVAAGTPLLGVISTAPDTKRAPRFSKTGLGIVLLIGLVFYFFIISRGLAPDEVLLRSLKSDTVKCSQILQAAQAQGIVTRIKTEKDKTEITVDEFRWGNAEYDLKLSIALAGYCLNTPADGYHTVYVYGNRDGKIKGSTTNGHWFSN